MLHYPRWPTQHVHDPLIPFFIPPIDQSLPSLLPLRSFQQTPLLELAVLTEIQQRLALRSAPVRDTPSFIAAAPATLALTTCQQTLSREGVGIFAISGGPALGRRRAVHAAAVELRILRGRRGVLAGSRV